MRACRLQSVVTLLCLCMAPCLVKGQAAAGAAPLDLRVASGSSEQPWSSSASALPEEPNVARSSSGGIGLPLTRLPSNRPFSALAVQIKAGVAGAGFDLATPLNSFLNLRGGLQEFEHDLNFNLNGLHGEGDLSLQTVSMNLDIYPFHNAFRISPGITIHNDNHYSASLSVPGGSSFELGDATYISDPTNPITGRFHFIFGNTVAPQLTFGFGNMLPRKGGHFSFPFEAGVQYISSPVLQLQLYGNACDSSGCGDINSSNGPENIQQEVQDENNSISGLRFYPIVSFGVSYKFGHH